MIEIREAQAGDATALTAIALAAKRHWGYPEDWITAWTPQLTLTPELLRTLPSWLAMLHGEPVGFVSLADHDPDWGIEHLWILPSHHGRGVGRRLLATALDFVARRRPGRVTIEADPNALGFYVHCGAHQIGTVPAPVLGTARELPLLEIHVRPA